MRVQIPPAHLTSYFSFLVHPLSNIGGTINDLSAARLTGPKKPNDIEIHERQFRQIQNKSGTILPEQLLLQFLDVFRLKVTNKTNRDPSALRVLFDPQRPASIRNHPDLVQVVYQRDTLNRRSLRREELLIVGKC